jgi:ribosomal protein S18 acetylase RimI-like enzyme
MSDSDAFIIRPATESDRAAILALVPRLREFGPPPLRPVEALDAGERRTLERFLDAPADDIRLFVAASPDGTLLGVAYAERGSDYFTQEPLGHLGILAVAAEAEGRGVGRALMAAVERWAAEQGYRFVTLNVFATNERAIAMYEHVGYQPDWIRYIKVLGQPSS